MNHQLRLARAFGALALVGASACMRGGRDDHAFAWSNDLPAGSVVHLRNGTGSITVTRAPGQTASVVGARRWQHGRARDVQFVVNRVGNDVFICAMWERSGSCSADDYHGSHSSQSILTMFALFRHSSDAVADIVAQLPANVVVDARTTLGAVHVTGINGGVTARSTNGGVQAMNVSGPIALSTVNGAVSLATDSLSPTDSVHLSTTNGAVRADLPASIDGIFDVATVNGMASSSLPLSPVSNRGRNRHHLQGRIGSSSRVVTMRATNGMVALSTHGVAAAIAPVPTSR